MLNFRIQSSKRMISTVFSNRKIASYSLEAVINGVTLQTAVILLEKKPIMKFMASLCHYF
jgi:hypothetical protein